MNKSERSQPPLSGSGRQRMNMMRATADAAFNASNSTFQATLVTGGTHKKNIGDTITVKNYASSANTNQEILVWAYDDGTFEMVRGVSSFDIAQIRYMGLAYATTTLARQEIALTNVTNSPSAVFSNRVVGATAGNIVISKPGTFQLFFPMSVQNERRQNQNSYTFLDQASGLNTFWQEHYGTQELIELFMYATVENNTTAPTSGLVAKAQVSAQDSGLFRGVVAPHQFDIPTNLGCVFSVAEANVPFELQMWTVSNTATGVSNAVRQLNDGYIIRYPDMLSTQITPSGGGVIPP